MSLKSGYGSSGRGAPEFLSHREPGRGCSKAVEHMPLEQKLVGSNPAGCLAFFFVSFPFSPPAKSVEFPVSGPSRRCISTNDEVNPKKYIISCAAWGKAKCMRRMEFKKASHREPIFPPQVLN